MLVEVLRDTGTLSANDAKGMYSYVNYKRCSPLSGPDPAVMIGYPSCVLTLPKRLTELGSWFYGKLVPERDKSFDQFLQLTEGQSYDIGDVKGVTLGKVTIKINDLNHMCL
ncbi:hypothetical protein CS542_10610 [Pedobacter sp. IW39]|nr:hypothetical protein CS542_10610 [Pedobacter sp. IW39]